MIVVEVKLHSAITGLTSELATLVIANDGTGTDQRGNYDCVALRKGHKHPMGVSVTSKSSPDVIRRCRVEGHRRIAEPVCNLVAKALKGMNYG